MSDNQKTEYVRLNDELMRRIDRSYDDCRKQASFYLIYYATVVGVLFKMFTDTLDNLSLIGLWGFVALSTVLFLLPILILFVFATKFKENFLAVCSISSYIKLNHELPTFKNNEKIKWESYYIDTLYSKGTKYITQDYTFLALISFCLGIIGLTCGVAEFLYMIFNSKINILFAVFTGLYLIILGFILLFFGIKYFYRICRFTNLEHLRDIAKAQFVQYKYKDNKLKNIAESTEEYSEMINNFDKAENELNKRLKNLKIVDYRALEIVKYEYFEKPNMEDDKLKKYLKKYMNNSIFQFSNKDTGSKPEPEPSETNVPNFNSSSDEEEKNS